MKSISKFISLALLIAAATACNTKEIDKPDIPDQPQISGNVRFTASMKQTRVEYSVNGDKLHQCWEKNDVIYGFYGDNPVRKVTLKVTEVDADEYATLEATDETEGAAFIAAIKEKGTDLKVGLLYTGSDNEVSGNTITVDMSDQSDGRIPACIESSRIDSIIEDEESGDTIVYFEFNNVCAILEIQSLTGIAEESTETIDLKSVSVSGVDESCTFTYAPPGFSQESESEPGSTIIVRSSDDRPLKADSDGNIIDADGNRSCIRIAVCPNFKSTITITATSTASDQYISQYQGSLSSSECYIICAKDVVAKTEDGFYFTTVNGAFDHAAELYQPTEDPYVSAGKNIVTLVRDCGLGGVDADGSPQGGDDVPIEEYNATLDLNGHTLTLFDCGFFVNYDEDEDKETFIIKDSDTNGNGAIICDGWDSEGYHLVDNYGTVKIDGGKLTHNADWCAVRNRPGATLTVNSGELYSNSYYTIQDEGSKVIVNNGKVSSSSSSAIYSEKGTVEITGGIIGNNYKYLEAIQVLGGTTCTISGGVIYSLGEQACTIGCRSTDKGDPVLTVKWPEESDDSSYEPIIYSAGVYSTTLPISAYMGGVNKADIIIKGGYLISNNTSGAFYCDCDYVDKKSNLNLNVKESDTGFNFGGFYSNMSYVIMDGSNPSGSLRDLSAEGGKGLPDDSGQHFKAILQNNTSLISAINEIIEEIEEEIEEETEDETEDETEEEKDIEKLFMIQAVV